MDVGVGPAELVSRLDHVVDHASGPAHIGMGAEGPTAQDFEGVEPGAVFVTVDRDPVAVQGLELAAEGSVLGTPDCEVELERSPLQTQLVEL